MLLKAVRLVNLILAGMLTGHEFAGLAAVYPALGKLPPLARLRAEQEVYRRYGKIMPHVARNLLNVAGLVLTGLGGVVSGRVLGDDPFAGRVRPPTASPSDVPYAVGEDRA